MKGNLSGRCQAVFLQVAKMRGRAAKGCSRFGKAALGVPGKGSGLGKTAEGICILHSLARIKLVSQEKL